MKMGGWIYQRFLKESGKAVVPCRSLLRFLYLVIMRPKRVPKR